MDSSVRTVTVSVGNLSDHRGSPENALELL
jgi:hypothetical protein